MRLFQTPTSSQRSVPIIVLAILLLGLAGVFVALCLSVLGVRKVDRQAAERETASAKVAVATLLTTLPKEQQGSTVWNDAVLQVHAGNESFMADNLGVWLQEFFGHDRDIVLGPDGGPVYASAEGATVPVTTQAEVYAAIRPMVSALRQKVLDAADAEDAAGLTVADIISVRGGPALVSLVPIVPEDDEVPFDPPATFLHVAVRHLDLDVAEAISAPYQLSAPRFENAPPPAPRLSVKVLDHAAQDVWLTWMPTRPGTALSKEIAPPALLAALACLMILLLLGLRLNRTTNELQRSEEHARHQALHDALTGLPNRMLLDKQLEEALALAQGGGPAAGVIMVDLDGFKQVNDAYGHPMGDKLVQQVGKRLARTVGEGATVARLGGDEFGILFPDVGTEDDLAEQCRWVQEGLSDPFRIDGHHFLVTASLGAVHSGACAPTRDEMIRCADIALYRSKNGGRAQFSLYHGDMNASNRKKARLAADLATVLAEGKSGITVQYHPIFDSQGALVGAEALARWTHPELGPIPPDVFVPLAEERGLIEPLGRAVLHEACRMAAATDLPKIAVNMSPLDICRAGFAPHVLSVLGHWGLPPSRLELELTERIAIKSRVAAEANITALLQAGVSLALDDFGIGHSSIGYLRQYGFTRVKIDSSFIQQIESDPVALKLVRAMIDMASALGIAVTAEGVETEAQLSALKSLGCGTFQGHLLAHPISGNALARLFRDATDNVTYLHPVNRSIA